MSLSHPGGDSHGRKERASKAMQEQAGITRKLPRSGLVVRLQWRLISTVQVRVGVCHTSVAEGDCVTARWGGKQPEANPRSVG